MAFFLMQGMILAEGTELNGLEVTKSCNVDVEEVLKFMLYLGSITKLISLSNLNVSLN